MTRPDQPEPATRPSTANAGVHYYSHPLCAGHDPGAGHPERPERLAAIDAAVRASGLSGRLRMCAPQPAPRAALERVHTAAYVEMVLGLRGARRRLDADTAVGPGSVEAALLAAGAALEATTAVLTGAARTALCAVRPPGHHAERDRAMGFCLFNNAAVAAAAALAGAPAAVAGGAANPRAVDDGATDGGLPDGGAANSGAVDDGAADGGLPDGGAAGTRAMEPLARVLVFDPDVHHGNGTQRLFYRSAAVYYVSIHQYPFYPGTGAAAERGAGAGSGYTLNLPLPAGSGDDDYLAATEHQVLPALRAFAPQLVIFSAGFDAHRRDPLGMMRVTTAGFIALYRLLLDELDRTATPHLFVLEGGYALAALGECVAALLTELTDRYAVG